MVRMFHLFRILSFATFILVGGTCAASDPLAGAPSTVVAKQGNAAVTLEDVDTFAQRIPQGKRSGFFNSPQRIQDAITSMLLQKQLATEARSAGLDKDPVVQQQVAMATDETLANVRMARLKDDITVPDLTQLAREEYLGHKENYLTGARLDVQHVVISTKSRSAAEAKALAVTVEKEAVARPDQFDALVDKYSDDPSKETDHGFADATGAKRYGAAFVETANALAKPGAISGIVETKSGFHVIKLIDHAAQHQQTFADVGDGILARLRVDYIEKAVRDHADELRNKPLDANPDLVASLRTRYGTAEDVPSPPPRQ
jgi:peptidyl-prolyl cis-trans isomerase C